MHQLCYPDSRHSNEASTVRTSHASQTRIRLAVRKPRTLLEIRPFRKMCVIRGDVVGKDLKRQLHLLSSNSIVGLPCWMHPAVHVLHMGAAYASLTPGPGEHLSPCVSPSYASALGHVGQKAGSTRNAHAPHPASGVGRRTLEGMLFCLGRATKTNYDGSEQNNFDQGFALAQ